MPVVTRVGSSCEGAAGAGRRCRRRDGARGATSIAWSPDSTRLAFDVQNVTFSPTCQTNCVTWSVYLINANGTGLHPIAIEARAPAWSRDGRKLAYEDLVTPYGEALGVAIDSINGLRVRFKAFNADSRVGPVRSPRANELAFGSRGSLCTVRADGTGRRRLTRGRAPTGSPDGTSIAFVRGGSVSQRLVVVDRLDSGPRWLGRTGSIVLARCMCPG